jgi:hypothetical protein
VTSSSLTAGESRKPDFTLDLSEAINQFTESKGSEHKASCQDPEYKIEALK